jgi:hypothetical protein
MKPTPPRRLIDTSRDSEGERLRQQLSDSEDTALLTKKKLAKFSQYILSQEAWFHTASKLIAAMKLLEPDIKSYWDSLAQNTKPRPEPSVTDVHMMLAGFAIENLCKGYLVGRLSPEDLDAIQAGTFPKSLGNHNILDLIESTEMTLSETEKYLIDQIDQAIWWRGRYPSSKSCKAIRPFVQAGSDIDRITTLLGRLRAYVGAKESQ